jgi:hypothetical protein
MQKIEANARGSITVFRCDHIGVSGLTKVHKRLLLDGRVELRMGFALLGSSNMSKSELEAVQYNPYHENFYDNYVEGTGATEEEALDVLKDRMQRVQDSLWAEF